MNEDKFKVWDIEAKIMDTCENWWAVTQSGNLILCSPNMTYKLYVKDKYKILWYTGMKDKNGVEIYKGDLLQNKTRKNSSDDSIPREVKWGVSTVKIGWIAPFIRSHWAFGYSGVNLAIINRKTEVIGNIYENPKLLEEVTANDRK